MALVSIDRYEVITGDTTSASALVEDALAEAQEMLEEELRRGLESAERTERLRIFYGNDFPGGRVYPAATPVTAASGYDLVGDTALDGASPDNGPFAATDPAYTDVTYTGGWTADNVPKCIERDIAWAAYRLLRPTDMAAVPAGAVAVALGDASVTFDRPRSAGEAGISWSKRTLGYRRRYV